MTQKESNRLKALERRKNWLQKRIFTEADNKQDLSFDRQELSALEWGIGIIEKELGIANPEKEECKHYWLLKNQDAVFCSRCLESRLL